MQIIVYELRRKGNRIPRGNLGGVTAMGTAGNLRYYRALADEQLIARSNERAELDWDQNEDEMAEDKAAQARMLVTRNGMKLWEADHRLAVSNQHAGTNQLV